MKKDQEQHIARIIEDIYALEPALRERDAEVRAMVRELLLAQPQIALDPSFVASLKARILAGAASRAVVTPYRHDMLWWALRIAPIGALAAITLALIGNPENPELPLPPELDSRPMGTQSAPATMEMSAPPTGAPMMMKGEPGMGGGMSAESRMASDATLMMDSGAAETDAAMTTPVFFAADQGPGSRIVIANLTIQTPAHVRVFAYEDGAPRAVLGTTGVLQAGTHADVPVSLSRTTRPGETLYAQLFASDGDDVFTPYADMPMRDSAGNPIYVIFMITDM
jgi:hypothetical protein